MIRDFKASSSGWMHRVFPNLEDFTWQNGYGAFTVSASQAANVKKYVEEQQLKHEKRTFQSEFVALLRGNGIEFDERYLWR